MLEKKELICCLLLLLSCAGFANERPSEYIERFKAIAISEMQRSQVPASITLAQAIHESAWGKGELAVYSNNFFGIKCKAEWQGKRYYKEDDDYDKNNKLMESCFRAYPNIEASFKDHSNFLRNGKRYEKLFKLDIQDYRAWAKGLQDCGYATDKEYAKKLIRTIEEYGLDQLDSLANPQRLIVEQPSYQVEDHLLEEPQGIQNNQITQEVRKWNARRNSNPQIPITTPIPTEDKLVHVQEKREKVLYVNGNSRQIQLKRKPRKATSIRR